MGSPGVGRQLHIYLQFILDLTYRQLSNGDRIFGNRQYTKKNQSCSQRKGKPTRRREKPSHCRENNSVRPGEQ